MFHAMRGTPLRYAQVRYHAGFEAGAASVTTACNADTRVWIGTTRRLETQACVVVLIVKTAAAGIVAPVVICADRLRPLLAAPACP